MVYYERDPFGNERADFHAAQAAWATFEVNRNHKKQKKPFQVKDFMPKFDQRHTGPQQTIQQQQMIAKMYTVAMGGTVKNG